MVRSFSNRASRTHWWNLMSSISTALPLLRRPVAWNRTLSFRPNFNSGMPDKNDFILMAPTISEWSTEPLVDTNKLRRSTTSKKISFLRCLMPSGRHDTRLVSCAGTGAR